MKLPHRNLGGVAILSWVLLSAITMPAAQVTRVFAYGSNPDGQTNVPPGLTNAVAIAVGYNHTVALRDDRTVVAWGSDRYGESTVPADLSNVVAVAAGRDQSLALTTAGRIVSWGLAYTGTNNPSGLSNVTAIAAGNSHGLALLGDGRVAAWGLNNNGQASVPPGLSNVIAIGAGDLHSIALRRDGTVVGWGISSTVECASILNLTNITAIAAGTGHSMALFADGQISGWCAGASTIPGEATNVVAIAAGYAQNMAIKADGRVVSWRMIEGTRIAVPTEATNAFAIGAGSLHQVILVNDGSPRITLQPVGGSLFVGSTRMLRCRAVGVAPIVFQWFQDGRPLAEATNESLVLSGVDAAAAGAYALLASNVIGSVTSDVANLTVLENAPSLVKEPANLTVFPGGTAELGVVATGSEPFAYQWFYNSNAITGATNSIWRRPEADVTDNGVYSVRISNNLGTVASSNAFLRVVPVATWGDPFQVTPQVPLDLTTVSAVDGGNRSSMALRGDGTVATWDTNGYTAVPANLSDVVAIASGGWHGLALKANGTVVAWGLNGSKQCNVPAGLNDVAAISAGSAHSIALRTDGRLVAWGDNFYGQTNIPASASNVVAIRSPAYRNLALLANGAVVEWGQRPSGMPADLTNAVAVAGGYSFSLALRRNGKVAVWGDNNYGQTNVPSGLSNVIAIAAGYFHGLALRNDGTIVGWGHGWQTNQPLVQAMIPEGLTNVRAIAAGSYHSLAIVGDPAPIPILSQLIQSPSIDGGGFSLQIPTQRGRYYALEGNDDLRSGGWHLIGLEPGNGATIKLSDSTSIKVACFYRVRIW